MFVERINRFIEIERYRFYVIIIFENAGGFSFDGRLKKRWYIKIW